MIIIWREKKNVSKNVDLMTITLCIIISSAIIFLFERKSYRIIFIECWEQCLNGINRIFNTHQNCTISINAEIWNIFCRLTYFLGFVSYQLNIFLKNDFYHIGMALFLKKFSLISAAKLLWIASEYRKRQFKWCFGIGTKYDVYILK